MAVTFGTISTFGSNTGYPWNFTSPATINTMGAKALLVLISNAATDKPHPAVTFQGAAMTHLGTANLSNGMIYAYGIVAPAQTATGSINVSINSNGDPANYTVIPINECHDTEPFGGVDDAFSSNGGTITNSIIMSADNNLVVSAIAAVYGPSIGSWTTGGTPAPVHLLNSTTQNAIPMKVVTQAAGAEGSTVTTTNNTQYNSHGLLSVSIKDSGGPAAQNLVTPSITNTSGLGHHLAKDPNIEVLGPTSIVADPPAFGGHQVNRQIVLFFDENAPGHTVTGTPGTVVERTSGAPGYQVSRASVPIVNGEMKYWEITVDNLTVDSIISLGGGVEAVPLTAQLGGWQSNAIGWDSSGGARQNNTGLNGKSTYTTGDVLMFAMDMTRGYLFGGLNGVWYNGSTAGNVNFASGDGRINNTAWSTSEGFYPAVETGTIGDKVSFNFGKQDFIYEPPAGYEAMDTGGPPNQDLEAPGIRAIPFLGSHEVLSTLQIVSVSGLSRADLMGSPSVGYIAYHEGFYAPPALGQPVQRFRMTAMGISNPFTLGTHRLNRATWLLEPEGVDGQLGQALGAAQVNQRLTTNGIIENGGLGDPVVRQRLLHEGILSDSLVGDPSVVRGVWNLSTDGIYTASALGNPEAFYYVNIPGINSEAFLGDHLISHVYDDAGIYPLGIRAQVAIGAHKLRMSLYADGLAYAGAMLGTPSVKGQSLIEPEGINLSPELGDPLLHHRLRIEGIVNTPVLGTGKIIQWINLLGEGLFTNTMLGIPEVILGDFVLSVEGIINESIIGNPRLLTDGEEDLSFVKVGGQWRPVRTSLVKHQGEWHELLSVLEKVDGSWQRIL